jgi:hypothetical protein
VTLKNHHLACDKSLLNFDQIIILKATSFVEGNNKNL